MCYPSIGPELGTWKPSSRDVCYWSEAKCQDWDHRRHGAIIYIIISLELYIMVLYIYLYIPIIIIYIILLIYLIFHWHSLTLSTAVCCMRFGIYAHLGGVLGQCGGWGHVQHLGKVQ